MPSDLSAELPRIDHELIHRGMVWDLVAERFEFGGELLKREFVDHPGAVAVIALDERSRLLLMQQYRHPVKSYLLELPAGLMDVAGESALDCAKRELAEEAGLRANSWQQLLSFYTSPGGSSESITIFVATDLSESEIDYQPTAEEKDMPKHWLEVEQALALVLQSKIKSPSAVVGILALAVSGKH